MSKSAIEKFVDKYDEKTLKKAYKSNLCLALEEVDKLIQRLPDNDIVISSDHGELLGENGDFGHPNALSGHKDLRTVPWLEVKS